MGAINSLFFGVYTRALELTQADRHRPAATLTVDTVDSLEYNSSVKIII